MKVVTLLESGKQFNVGKVICVGKNYLEHAKELGDAVPEKPVIFMKPSSSIIFSGEKVIYPSFSKSLHYETELVILIGKQGKNVKKEFAIDFIAGYTVGLDMTLRDWQTELKKKGHPWEISKCFDTSTVIGNFISKERVSDPNNLDILLWVNQEIRQQDNTKNMIFNVYQIIEYVSEYFTLEEGDLIFTGTPKGVGEVNVGDMLKAKIPSVAELQTIIGT
ncbi:MAG: fumarylacetoacetate hydrolase family protein [Ignavibacteria bacterium]|nr:fumarylacetoacetate hydrolase family protein [Ignavibacteria bacterium]